MSLPAPSSRLVRHLRIFRIAYVALLIGLSVSAFATVWLRRQYATREDELFAQKASELEAEFGARLASSEVFLQGCQGLFASEPVISPEQFSIYLHHALNGVPQRALLDIGFAMQVPADQVAEHEREMRRLWSADYFIQTGPDGIVGGVAYPATHVAGLDDGVVRVIGWDMGQDPVRRRVIESALDSGLVAASGIMQLHRSMITNKITGILVALPVVFQTPATFTASTTNRPAGVIFGSLIARELWKRLEGGLDGVQFRAFVNGEPPGRDLAFDSGTGDADGAPRRKSNVAGLGRVWRLEFHDSERFRSEFHSHTPEWIGFATGLFTMFVSGIAATLTLHRREAESAAEQLRISEARAVLALARLEERERQVATERDRLDVTLRSIGDAVITTDSAGRIESVNPAAEEMLGIREDQALGGTVAALFSLRERASGKMLEDLPERMMAAGSPMLIPGFFQLLCEDKPERTVVVAMAPLKAARTGAGGRVLVLRDLTERRQLEEEQIRASKLESVGLLAGGIAHDFNNFLTAVLGNLSLARGETSESGRDLLLERAEHSVKRAQRLTQQLLTFAKGGAPVIRPTDLRELVRDTVEFATRGLNVKCEFDLAPDLWPSATDPAQISRVIQNLAVNAAQAMRDGGVIRVIARNEPEMPRLGEGRFVKVSVEDEGPGIPPHHLGRMFEPYFSTKSGGSGLGLATAFRIVRQHRGDIMVKSEPGRGACFEVYLPASDGSPVPDVPVPSLPTPGAGRILIMDDEPAIREVARAMLKRLGYEAESVTNGEAAIHAYLEARDRGRPYDVVILDLTVPDGSGGLETLRRLRELDPAVAAVVSSGYSSDPVMAEFRDYGFSGVLAKPYRLDEMSAVIHLVRQK